MKKNTCFYNTNDLSVTGKSATILHKVFRCLTLLFLFAAFSSPGQAPVSDVSIPELRNKVELLVFQDPDSAFSFIDNGLEKAREAQDSCSIAFFYLAKGVAFGKIHPDRAVSYFFKARKLYSQVHHIQGVAVSYMNLAIHANISPERQFELLKEALRLYTQIADTTGIIRVYNNMGTVFSGLNKVDSALYYFELSASLAARAGSDEGLAVSYINTACMEMAHSNYELALDHLRKALTLMPEEKKVYRGEIYFNIMQSLLESGRRDSALYYYDLLKQHFPGRPDLQLASYRLLSRISAGNENYKTAFYYDQKGDSIQKEILAHNNQSLLKLLELEYEGKIREERIAGLESSVEKANILRLFLISLLVLSVIFSFVVSRLQNQKNRKKREVILQKKRHAETEQRLLSAELQNSELQRQYLDDELKYTNKELTSFATNIVQNHTLINDIRIRLNDITSEKDNQKIKRKLRELNTMLLQVFNNNDQRNEFMRKSKQLNHSLMFYLKSHFSHLTESDLNLLVLLLLKFSSKEISVLYNIEPESVKKKRYRLRKKLNLDNQDSFEDFFESLMSHMNRDMSKHKQAI